MENSRIQMANNKKILIVLGILDFALVVFSLIRFPAAGLINASPVLGVLVMVGLAVWWVWERLVPQARRWGVRMGAAAGLVLGGEVLLEYVFLPVNNSVYGQVEYGLFLLALVTSGVLAFRENGTLKGSTQAGLWAGMIGSLIWFGVVLLVFHLFFGTAQQAQVFQAEGNLEDFTRSGMADFTAFVVQDFFGAGFFHLLLGAAVGALFGFIGGVGARFTRLR